MFISKIFGEVTGKFTCHESPLLSTLGGPKIVGGKTVQCLECTGNSRLTSIEGLPKVQYFGELSYYADLPLLGFFVKDREKFIIDNMPVRLARLISAHGVGY